MTELKIGKKTYKIEFGYNSFCDTDLMERTSELISLFDEENVTSDKDVAGLKKIKDLFVCVRELLYVGFKKHNAVMNVQEVGDLLDQYKKEEKDGEKHGLFDLFAQLSEELLSEGFLADILETAEETAMETEVEK